MPSNDSWINYKLLNCPIKSPRTNHALQHTCNTIHPFTYSSVIGEPLRNMFSTRGFAPQVTWRLARPGAQAVRVFPIYFRVVFTSGFFLFAPFLFCLRGFSFICLFSFLFACFPFFLFVFFFVCVVSFYLRGFFFICFFSFLFSCFLFCLRGFLFCLQHVPWRPS